MQWFFFTQTPIYSSDWPSTLFFNFGTIPLNINHHLFFMLKQLFVWAEIILLADIEKTLDSLSHQFIRPVSFRQGSKAYILCAEILAHKIQTNPNNHDFKIDLYAIIVDLYADGLLSIYKQFTIWMIMIKILEVF